MRPASQSIYKTKICNLSFLDLLPYQLLSDCWSYIDNDENVASFKNTEHTKFKIKMQKPCPVLDQNDQKSISHLSVCKEPYPLRLDTLIPI